MVFGFMKRGWATKPSLSDGLYLKLLDEAFSLLLDYRDMETISLQHGVTANTVPTQQQVGAMLTEVQDEFNRLEAATRNLEQIRPRSNELMDVHVATIGYFRAFLLKQDRFTMGVVEGMQGRKRQADKLMKESDKWDQSFRETHTLLRGKIIEVGGSRPDIFVSRPQLASVLRDLRLRY
jgi:hypothetical protein